MRRLSSIFTLLVLDTSMALKILCLHGGGQSWGMQNEPGMVALQNSLPTMEFVYASAPYSGGVWIRDPPGGKNQATTDPNWTAESITLLNNIVQSQGPFHGILGYSQGTAMALTYLAAAPEHTFQVVMLFCGYIPTTHNGLTDSINMASPFGGVSALIWIGQQDSIISPAMSQAAAAKFTSPTIIISPTGTHAVPDASDSTYSSVVEFISQSGSRPALPPTPPLLPLPPQMPPTPPSAPESGTDEAGKLGIGSIGAIAGVAVVGFLLASFLVSKIVGGKNARPPPSNSMTSSAA